jgi:ribosomal protein L29
MRKYTKESNEKTTEELEKAIKSIRAEIVKLQVESGITQQKNTNTIGNKKKQLAVLLTVLRQKKA